MKHGTPGDYWSVIAIAAAITIAMLVIALRA